MKNKNFSTNIFIKLLVFVLIPLGLLIFWVAASLAFNNKISFSVLEYAEDNSSIAKAPVETILKGNKIWGTFKASEENLGLVLLKFNNYVKPDYSSEDVLSFSIKQVGQKDWYYSGRYRSGAFEHQSYFPFGFTPIANSKNKFYQFELTSLNGNSSNALTLSKNSPVLITAYQFSKKEIFQSKSFLIRFITEKIATSFTDLDFVLSSVLYLLPLLLYLLWIINLKQKTYLKRYLSLVTLLFIVIDVFILKNIYLGVLLGLIISWIITVKLKRLESKVSFIIAFALLFIWIVSMFIHLDFYSNKLNVWVYAFLIIGVFQAVVEERSDIKGLVGYKTYFNNFFKLNGKI
jgi:hypothetical protein